MKKSRATALATSGALLATLLVGAMGSPAVAHDGDDHATTEAEFKALIFSETAGFVHDSVPEARAMWDELAAAEHFEVVQASDSALFTDEGLADFDVIVLANASGDVWNADEEAAFERYVRGGGGVVAMHNPLDMEQGNTFYRNLIGTEFTAHSAAGTQGVLEVVDHEHPSTAGLPESITRNEEWYGFTKSVRGDKHVLTEMDPTSVPANTPGRMIDHPVTWCSPYEGGRTWITSIGHAKSAYAEPLVREHALGGIRYAAGVAPGDCAATDWANFDKVALDTNTSAPWGIAVAPDGRVFFTELVRGQVRVYDPELQSTVTAATIPVYGGGEDGLLGLALDNGFSDNGYVYLYYSPQDAPSPDGFNRLSRFTMEGNTMDLESEVVMLEVPAGRGTKEIGHTGGTLRMDGNGDLWLSVGDDVVPFESSGYTPIDERPGRAHFDAQGTSANSNDLRGKLLRIHPEADGSYSIPEGNMFPEADDADDKTRPEIYAMGFRNPFRFSVDTDGTVFLADYGPDAGSASPTRGPAGYVEWQVIREPGNYGWPYCHANNIAYNDYDFATSVAGAKFDCANPVNESPNNTGLTTLPASIPADVYYSYGASAEFPQLGSGSGSPMAGPVYHFDADSTSERKWPKYFDGTPLFFEWGRNYIKEFPLLEDGTLQTINPVLNSMQFLSPLDLQFGPDGALYLLEWGGGFGRDNPNSGLYRIDYTDDGRAPSAVASADVTSGLAPLTVEFSSEGTVDRDGHEFDVLWEFGDGTTSTEANPSHVYTANGNYEARLTVTERTEFAKTGTATVSIVVGNTAPQVSITTPPDGGFFEWGDVLPWQVEVSDAEDGTIDCGDVIVQPALGHDEHAHPTLAVNACEGETLTILDEGHLEADAFWVIDARYTDAGAEGVQPITTTATNVYRAKRFQAHYYDDFNGVAVENNAAAEYGQYVGAIQDNDWIKYEDMNFQGIDSVRYRVSAGPEGGGRIEMRLGAPDGELIASTPVNSTGGWFTFANTTPTPITAPAGTHDVYLVFRSNPGVNWSMTLDAFEAVGAGIGTPPPGTPSIDRSTKGDWIGTYGELGYSIPNVGAALPSGVTVAPVTGTSPYTWEETSTSAAALQLPPDGTTRRASTWFAPTAAQVQVGVPEGERYEMSVYVNSFDQAREETIAVTRADGSALGPVQSITDNKSGVWLTYVIDGSVKVSATKVTGPNAVLGGIFFDEAPSSADETAPTVAAQTLPMEPGATGWFTEGDVQVQLTATDAGSGVDTVEYAIGDGAWAAYTDPVTITEPGVTTVKYRATDVAGNVTEPASLDVRIDREAPTATATTVPVAPSPDWQTHGVELTLAAEDEVSGVATLRYAVGPDGAWVNYTEPVRISVEGPSTIRYQAVDVAGNESAVQEIAVDVPHGPAVAVAADSRCIAGKAVLTVTVTNLESSPMNVTITTPYGVKKFTGIQPGKNAFHAFSTRKVDLPADEVSVEATVTVDGQSLSGTSTAAYTARSCG